MMMWPVHQPRNSCQVTSQNQKTLSCFPFLPRYSPPPPFSLKPLPLDLSLAPPPLSPQSCSLRKMVHDQETQTIIKTSRLLVAVEYFMQWKRKYGRNEYPRFLLSPLHLLWFSRFPPADANYQIPAQFVATQMLCFEVFIQFWFPSIAQDQTQNLRKQNSKKKRPKREFWKKRDSAILSLFCPNFKYLNV